MQFVFTRTDEPIEGGLRSGVLRAIDRYRWGFRWPIQVPAALRKAQNRRGGWSMSTDTNAEFCDAQFTRSVPVEMETET